MEEKTLKAKAKIMQSLDKGDHKDEVERGEDSEQSENTAYLRMSNDLKDLKKGGKAFRNAIKG